MDLQVLGPIVVLALISSGWAVASVLSAPGGRQARIVWIVLILGLPVAGSLAWLLVGARADRASA